MPTSPEFAPGYRDAIAGPGQQHPPAIVPSAIDRGPVSHAAVTLDSSSTHVPGDVRR